MLYLTCTTISSVDLAQYGVPLAKDWLSVDCGTIVFSESVTAEENARFCREVAFLRLFISFFLF